MPGMTGYVDNANGNLAHYNLLALIKAQAEATGWWTTLRYDDTVANRELILKGEGYSGDKEIFVGLRTYQSAADDYYNLLAAAFTGYVSGNTFDTQPGAVLSGVPAHNNRIDYWIDISPQRIAGLLKVGSVYETFYIGLFLPYARPSQYPYPILCAGMLYGAAATRYSNTAYNMPWKTQTLNCQMRMPTGWVSARVYPWSNSNFQGSGSTNGPTRSGPRDTNGLQPLLPAVLHHDSYGLVGELEGIYNASGFSMASEDTVTFDGHSHVVGQDAARTTYGSFFALRLN